MILKGNPHRPVWLEKQRFFPSHTNKDADGDRIQCSLKNPLLFLNTLWTALLKETFTGGPYLSFLYKSSSTYIAHEWTVWSFLLGSSGQGGVPKSHHNSGHPLCTPTAFYWFMLYHNHSHLSGSGPRTVLFSTFFYHAGWTVSLAIGLLSLWLIQDRPVYDRPSRAAH